jgi:hypothetical protein
MYGTKSCVFKAYEQAISFYVEEERKVSEKETVLKKDSRYIDRCYLLAFSTASRKDKNAMRTLFFLC